MVGGANTASVAEAVFPGPPLVEVTFEVVLVLAPAVVPVTLTEMVQEALAATVPPARLTLFDPAVAVATPPHVLARPFGVDTTRPPGSGSLKPTPTSATVVFGFVILKVRLVLPFSATATAPNVLVIAGGATTVSDAVLFVPP